MKTTMIILLFVVAMLMSLAAWCQTTLSNDVGVVSYKGGVFSSAGLRGVQDAVPAIAVLAWPDPSAVTTQIVVRILDDMSKTNAVTNVVLTGNASIGSDGNRFDIYRLNGQGNSLTKIGNDANHAIF